MLKMCNCGFEKKKQADETRDLRFTSPLLNTLAMIISNQIDLFLQFNKTV